MSLKILYGLLLKHLRTKKKKKKSTSGHWHALGYSNKGFNMFTGPSLQYTNSSGQSIGFLFYIIDPGQKAIKVIMCSKNFTDFTAYDYTY